MLCPRCNSENDLGEKFCRHCGAPLIDRELFLDPKEKKKLEKQKKLQKKQELKNAKKNNYDPNVTGAKRTYSLSENAYRRSQTSVLLSLAKSLVILLVIIIGLYFLVGFILTKVYENADTYSVGGIKIPSANFVLGDRQIRKVKDSYKDKIFKTEYIFKNVEEPTTDIIKYISYLLENDKFEIINDFNPSFDTGSTKLATKSSKTFDDMIVVELSWTTKSITVTTYTTKSTLQ